MTLMAQQVYELLGGTSMGGARPKTVVEDKQRALDREVQPCR